MRKLILTIFILSLSNAALSADKHDPKCDSPMQQDLMECAYNDFHQSDAKLNKLYRKLIAAAETADKASKSDDDNVGNYESDLRQSEKAWVVFRDAECARTSAPNHILYGLEGDLDYPECLAGMTEERIKQLSAVTPRGTSDGSN